MAQSPNISLQPKFTYLISGSNPSSLQLLNSAWQKMDQAYRPSTSSAHRTHFRTFISFIYFMDLPMSVTLHNVLVFLEYLHQNSLSPKVIKNYLSSIATMSKAYSIDYTATYHPAVLRYIRGLSLTSPFRPTPRGIFDIPTLYAISKQCETLSDPILFRAIFLTSFYAFLRMSNIAPLSSKQFNPQRHLLRQDVIFAPPGAHIILKWCKTMQDAKSTHIVQIPEIANIWLCPVRALKTRLVSRHLTSTSPLFANAFYPHSQVIDTHIRDALKTILTNLKISHIGHGFHSFRRSGATLAFDHSVPLQNIMAHGLWRSPAIWTYLQNSTQASSLIPSTFSSVISSSF